MVAGPKDVRKYRSSRDRQVALSVISGDVLKPPWHVAILQAEMRGVQAMREHVALTWAAETTGTEDTSAAGYSEPDDKRV